MLQGLMARIGTTLAGAAIVGGAGLAAGLLLGIAYENTVPWGLGAQLKREMASVERRVEEARADQLRRDRTTLSTWQAGLRQCEERARQQSADVALVLDRSEERARAVRESSYDLGRRAGLAQCRRNDAPADAASPDAGPVLMLPDDVELRELLGSAAYRPSPR